MACCPEPQPQPRMELKEGTPETDRAESMAALSKGAGAQEGRPLNLCLETSSLFPLPLPRQAQPGSSHLKWVPGSLGERGWPGCRPVRPTPPPCLGPSPSWGRGREGELSLQTHPSRGPSLPHTPSEAPLQLFQPWRGVGRRGMWVSQHPLLSQKAMGPGEGAILLPGVTPGQGTGEPSRVGPLFFSLPWMSVL